MTTAAALSRIYEKMPPAALAAMVINAAVAGDDAEMNRIMAAVPRRSYTCPDAEYTLRRDNMQAGLLEWAVDYWKAVAFMMVRNTDVLLQGAAGDDVGAMMAADASFRRWARYRRILDAALTEMCAYAGLDEPRIRAWLKVPDVFPHRELTPDEREVMEERLADWRAALDFK